MFLSQSFLPLQALLTSFVLLNFLHHFYLSLLLNFPFGNQHANPPGSPICCYLSIPACSRQRQSSTKPQDQCPRFSSSRHTKWSTHCRHAMYKHGRCLWSRLHSNSMSRQRSNNVCSNTLDFEKTSANSEKGKSSLEPQIRRKSKRKTITERVAHTLSHSMSLRIWWRNEAFQCLVASSREHQYSTVPRKQHMSRRSKVEVTASFSLSLVTSKLVSDTHPSILWTC